MKSRGLIPTFSKKNKNCKNSCLKTHITQSPAMLGACVLRYLSVLDLKTCGNIAANQAFARRRMTKT